MTFSSHETPVDQFWSEENGFSSLAACHGGKTVLVTGAGGWIGSALSKIISESAPRALILLDHAEHDLYRVYNDLTGSRSSRQTTIVPILGDICDSQQLNDILSTYRPKMIYHLAAFKHVPLGECNPCAVIRNNVIGTYRLAMAARRHRAAKLTMVSTDKAANPQSLMGVSKRVAELVLLALSNPLTQMNAIRFGNVYGSRGSVVPLLQQQIARGGPITITHPDANRYFITLCEAVNMAFAVAVEAQDGILVPELGKATRILELAEFLIRQAGRTLGEEIAIRITGLRPGDKIEETLISDRETRGISAGHGLTYLKTPMISEEELHVAMDWLESCVQTFNLSGMLAGLCAMVPDYEPSLLLQTSANLLWCAAEVI